MKNICNGVKRKVAALMVVVMTIQTVLTSGTPIMAFAATGAREGYLEYQIKDKSPEDIYDKLTLGVLNKVTEDGGIRIKLDGMLDDNFIQRQYSSFIDDAEGLSEAEFNEGESETEDGPPANKQYKTYEEYLNAVSDDYLPPLSFSISIDKELLDSAMLGEGGDLSGTTSDHGTETFGQWVIEEDENGNYRLSVTVEKWIYYRQNVNLGMSANLTLREWYEPGTEISKDESSGDEEIKLTIGGGGQATPADANYNLKKEVWDADGNKVADDAMLSDRDFSYVLTATTSNYQTQESLLKDIKASGSNYSYNPKTFIADTDLLEHYRDASASDTEILEDYYDTEEERDFWASVYKALAGNSEKEESEVTLHNKVITDTLPAGLDLTGLHVRLADTADWIELTEDMYYYDSESGVLKYTIGDGIEDLPPDSKINFAQLKLDVKVSDSIYKDFITKGESVTHTFPNRAFLKDDEDGDNLAISNRVEPKVQLDKFLSKEGEDVNSADGTMKWKLHVNAQFDNEGVKLWAVDHIEDIEDTHTFDASKGIQINGGASVKVVDITELLGTDSLSYVDIKHVSAIEDMLAAAGITDADTGAETVYMYTYSYEKEGKEVKDAILLVPLHKGYLNGDTEITYSTKLSEALLSDPSNYGKQLTMKNEANILWKWPNGGEGTGFDEGSATIDKVVGTTINVLGKAATDYDEESGTITWEVEINRSGVQMTDATFWDIFTDTEQTMKPSSLVLTDLNTNKTITIHDGNEGTAPTPYYTYENDAEKTHKYTLYLGNLLENGGHYKLRYKTEVLTGTVSTNTSKINVTNTAHLSGMVNDKPTGDISAIGNQEIDNTLITKEVVSQQDGSSYNYETNTVRWKVTVNPRHWAIENAKITDVLPKGLRLAGLVSVDKINGAATEHYQVESESNTDGTKTIWTATNTEKTKTITLSEDDGATDEAASFTAEMGDIDSKYEFVFDTYVAEWYRKTLKTGQNYALENKATLTGTHTPTGGTPMIIDTSDTATANVSFNPLAKSGKYEVKDYTFKDDYGQSTSLSQVPVLSWDLYVNRTGVDISGATLTDMMENEESGDAFMYLVPGSINVYEIELNADGTVRQGSEVLAATVKYNDNAESRKFEFKAAVEKETVVDSTSTVDSNGLTYKIPDIEGGYRKTLHFAFDTLLSDEVTAGNMKNSAAITIDNQTDSVTSPKAEGAKDFYVENYSSASGVYLIKLRKISENHEDKQTHPLRGAKFTIQEMMLNADGADGSKWENWKINEDFAAKTKTSNRRGNLTFLFLKADTMYRIVETKAPAGYDIVNNTWYFVPRPTANATTYPEELSAPDVTKRDPIDSNNTNTYQFSIQEKDASGNATKNCLTADAHNGITKDPDGQGKISFTKVGQNGQILPGVWFELKHSKGTLATRYEKSKPDGVVTFDKVDPLSSSKDYYVIKELAENPETHEESELTGYTLLDGELRVKVSWDATANDGKGGCVTTYTKYDASIFDPHTSQLKNTPIRKSGAFSKVDQNGDKVTSTNIEFSVARLGDGGTDNGGMIQVTMNPTVNPTEQNPYQEYLPQKTVSSDKGIVNLKDFYYGFYKLTEQENSNVLGTPAPVYLYVGKNSTGDGIFTLPAKAQPLGDQDAAKLGADAYTVKLGTDYKVTNILNYGYVALTKVRGEQTAADDYEAAKGSKLSGVKFAIYEADAAGTAPEDEKTPYLTLITDEDGKLTSAVDGMYQDAAKTNPTVSKALLVGKYVMREISDSANGSYRVSSAYIPFTVESQKYTTIYTNAENQVQTVTLTDAEKGKEYTFMNIPKRGTLSFEKVDADNTGKTLTGAVFGIYDGTVQVAQVKDQGTAGQYKLAPLDTTPALAKNGIPYLSGNDTIGYALLVGTNYTMKELTAPEGYAKSENEVTVKIEDAKNTVVTGVDASTGQITNTLKHGFVELDKADPQDNGYVFKNVAFTLYAADGTRIGNLKQTAGTNHFEQASSSDAVKDSKGDAYLVWDDTAKKTALIYGDYYVVETGYEPGYLADLDQQGQPVRHAFKISEDGATVAITNDSANRQFENRKARGSFDVVKEKEIVGDQIFQTGVDKAAGEGFVFRISWKDTTTGTVLAGADVDIRSFATVTGAASSSKGSGDDRWIEATTDGDGRFTLGNLLAGDYTIEELHKDGVNDAYVLASAQRVTVKVDQTSNQVEAANAEFVNLLKRGTIQGLKTTSTGAPLANATMGLFPADTTSFVQANLFHGVTAVSGEDGKFTFANVPYGTYRVAELKAPNGYDLNRKTSYLVTVHADGAVITAGILEEHAVPAGTEPTDITIVNSKSSSGGGGTTPPTKPITPTEPETPTQPTEPETPAIPTVPGNPPHVEIHDPNGDTIYDGPGTDVNVDGWGPGRYTIYTFDDNEVPLGQMIMVIGDNGIPLAFMLPKTGDQAVPYALLAVIMLGALGGITALVYRRKEEES